MAQCHWVSFRDVSKALHSFETLGHCVIHYKNWIPHPITVEISNSVKIFVIFLSYTRKFRDYTSSQDRAAYSHIPGLYFKSGQGCFFPHSGTVLQVRTGLLLPTFRDCTSSQDRAASSHIPGLHFKSAQGCFFPHSGTVLQVRTQLLLPTFRDCTSNQDKAASSHILSDSLPNFAMYCHSQNLPSSLRKFMLVTEAVAKFCSVLLWKFDLVPNPPSQCPWSGVVRLVNVGSSFLPHDAGQKFFLFYLCEMGMRALHSSVTVPQIFFIVLLTVHRDISVQ